MARETIREAVWAGNHWGRDGSVARAKDSWKEHLSLGRFPGESDLYPTSEETVECTLQLVNALYSAFTSVYHSARRGNPRSLWRACDLLLTLQPLYAHFLWRAQEPSRLEDLTADQKEELGAQLVRYADIPVIGGPGYRAAAVEYATRALSESMNDLESHTAPLAALTLARAEAAFGDTGGHVCQHLRFAEKRIEDVSDPNQKARIYRSCAELWHMFGEKDHALELIAIASAVQGIGDDVRAKIEEVRRSIASS